MDGFIGKDEALRKSDDTRTALERMDKIATKWLPVIDRVSLKGFVERADLAASLVVDVADAIVKK